MPKPNREYDPETGTWGDAEPTGGGTAGTWGQGGPAGDWGGPGASPGYGAAPAGTGAAGTPPGSAPTQNYWRDYFRTGYGAGPREGIGYQTANQDQARLQQQQVIQELQRQAAGDPNSRAQQQLQQSYQGAQAQQSSLGSTMRGQSAGAAMRGIQAGQQGIQRGLAGDQQMLQLQEQQAAQAMLAQLLAQQQGQDITQATGMAQGQLGSQGLDDAMLQFYLGGALGQDLLATEQGNQIGRARAGFQDANNALTAQMVNAGANATAGALGTLGTFGTPPVKDKGTNYP